MADEQGNPGIKVPSPLIYLLALLLRLLLDKRSHVLFLPRGMGRITGWPLFSGGVLLGAWFFWSLRRAGTPVDSGELVTRLVADGPHRYTHNPGYLFMAMIWVGIATLANALWAVLLLPATLLVIQRGGIEREESYPERKFGEEHCLSNHERRIPGDRLDVGTAF